MQTDFPIKEPMMLKLYKQKCLIQPQVCRRPEPEAEPRGGRREGQGGGREEEEGERAGGGETGRSEGDIIGNRVDGSRGRLQRR